MNDRSDIIGFLDELTQTRGRMLDGNHLSERAKEILTKFYAACPFSEIPDGIVADSLLHQLLAMKANWEFGNTSLMQIHPKDMPAASLFVHDLDSFIKSNMAELSNVAVVDQTARPVEHKLAAALQGVLRHWPVVYMRGSKHHKAVQVAHEALAEYTTPQTAQGD